MEPCLHERRSDFGTSGVTWLCEAAGANQMTPALFLIRRFEDFCLDPLHSMPSRWHKVWLGMTEASKLLRSCLFRDKMTRKW